MAMNITVNSLQYEKILGNSSENSWGTVCKLPQLPASATIKENGSDINVNIIDFVTVVS